jgi:hypothetical protein
MLNQNTPFGIQNGQREKDDFHLEGRQDDDYLEGIS